MSKFLGELRIVMRSLLVLSAGLILLLAASGISSQQADNQPAAPMAVHVNEPTARILAGVMLISLLVAIAAAYHLRARGTLMCLAAGTFTSEILLYGALDRRVHRDLILVGALALAALLGRWAYDAYKGLDLPKRVRRQKTPKQVVGIIPADTRYPRQYAPFDASIDRLVDGHVEGPDRPPLHGDFRPERDYGGQPH